MAEFVTVGRPTRCPRARRRRSTSTTREIAVARVDGALYAFDDICTPSPLQPRARRRDRGHHDRRASATAACSTWSPARRRTRPPPRRSRSSGSARPTARSRSRSERPVTAPETIVVVGASLAGATAAATLRDQGFDGSVHAARRRAAAAVRAPGALEGVPARGATDRGAPRAPARVVRGPRDRAPYRYARRAARRERPRGRPRRRRAPGLRPVVRGDRLPQPHARRCPGSSLPGIYELRTADHAAAIHEAAAGGARVVVRRHGVHRRRGRRVPANPRLRRNGRGGLRDHPVSDPGPRHRAGARGDPPRSRGDDGVQRHGGERSRATGASRPSSRARVAGSSATWWWSGSARSRRWS